MWRHLASQTFHDDDQLGGSFYNTLAKSIGFYDKTKMIKWILHYEKLVPHDIKEIPGYSYAENVRCHARKNGSIDIPINRRAQMIERTKQQTR